jgi:hypothetical protein
MGPAGVETGTSTSSRCSLEPHGIDSAKGRGAVPNLIPSIAMACVAAASVRNTVTLTREYDALPGQFTFNANRVEITNDPEVFLLLSPGFEAPR